MMMAYHILLIVILLHIALVFDGVEGFTIVRGRLLYSNYQITPFFRPQIAIKLSWPLKLSKKTIQHENKIYNEYIKEKEKRILEIMGNEENNLTEEKNNSEKDNGDTYSDDHDGEEEVEEDQHQGYARTDLEDHSLTCLDFPKLLSYLSQEVRTLPGQVRLTNSYYNDVESVKHAYAMLEQLSTYIPLLPIQGKFTLLHTLQNIARNGAPPSRKELFQASEDILNIAQTHSFFKNLITQEQQLTLFAPLLPHLSLPVEVLETFRDAFIEMPGSDIVSSNSDLSNSFSEASTVLYKLNPKKFPTIRSYTDQIQTLQSRIIGTLRSLISRPEMRAKLATATGGGNDFFSIVDGRYCLAVTNTYKRGLGVIHAESNSGKTAYVEPHAVVELTNELKELEIQLRAEENRLFFEMVRCLAQHMSELHLALNTLGDIDLLRAKHLLGKRMQTVYTIPEVGNEGVIEVQQARHPLLVLKMTPSSTESSMGGYTSNSHNINNQHSPVNTAVVPTALSLSSSHSALIISGPNAGGKTIALKTAGLLAMMVRYAMPLPVTSVNTPARVDFFEHVLADIGDSQSVSGDRSTFSGHLWMLREMLETVQKPRVWSPAGKQSQTLRNGSNNVSGDENNSDHISNNENNNGNNHKNNALDNEHRHHSLVLLDEVGTGTDPAQGAVLGQAVLESLVSQGCRVLVTTHYPRIKELASLDPRFQVAAMEFVQDRPTYRLRMGLVGESFALELAQRLSLPRSVIQRASSLLDDETKRILLLQRRLEEALSGTEEIKDRLAEREAKLAETEKAFQKQQQAFQQEIEEVRAKKYETYLIDLSNKELSVQQMAGKAESLLQQQQRQWQEVQQLKAHYQQQLAVLKQQQTQLQVQLQQMSSNSNHNNKKQFNNNSNKNLIADVSDTIGEMVGDDTEGLSTTIVTDTNNTNHETSDSSNVSSTASAVLSEADILALESGLQVTMKDTDQYRQQMTEELSDMVNQLSSEKLLLQKEQALKDMEALQCVPLPTDTPFEVGTEVIVLEKGALFGLKAAVSQRYKGRGARLTLRVAGTELKLPKHLLALPRSSILYAKQRFVTNNNNNMNMISNTMNYNNKLGSAATSVPSSSAETLTSRERWLKQVLAEGELVDLSDSNDRSLRGKHMINKNKSKVSSSSANNMIGSIRMIPPDQASIFPKRSSANTIDVRLSALPATSSPVSANTNANGNTAYASESLQKSLGVVEKYLNNEALDMLLSSSLSEPIISGTSNSNNSNSLNDLVVIYVWHGTDHPSKQAIRNHLVQSRDRLGIIREVYWPVRSSDGGDECTVLVLGLEEVL